MAFLSTIFNSAGLLFLVHGVYSSYEHSLTHTPSTTLTSTAAVSTANPIPADIVLEILVSTTLLCIGIVLASPGLRPIQWRTWACEAEKDERRPRGKRAFEAEVGQGVGNFGRFVEDGERRGFWDVRGKRKEFAAWVRDGSKSDVQI